MTGGHPTSESGNSRKRSRKRTRSTVGRSIFWRTALLPSVALMTAPGVSGPEGDRHEEDYLAERAEHHAVLMAADAALIEAERNIEESRARLESVIKAYDDRMADPRGSK